MLNSKIFYIKSYEGYNVTVNTSKFPRIIKDFNLYPYKTKKSLVYYKINKMYMLVVDKTHLTSRGFNLIKRYKKNLNKLDLII